MINFSDLTFIFRFLPVFILAFYLTPARFRNVTLLIGSLAFYAVGDIKMFPVLLGAVVINFLFSRALKGGGSKALLGFAICLDALMLVGFKLTGQFVDSAVIPVGVSFFTFKMISFQVDNYRGKVPEDAGFVDVAAYFTMFPQIVSGPIMRYEDFKLNDLSWAENIEDGLRFFTIGLGLKVLLADHLSMLWNDIGTIGYESISTPLA